MSDHVHHLFSSVSSTGLSGNWIEIAYGTSSGTVRVIVQHPETVGHGPQLFQTFTVHRSPVTKVMLSEKHLVSGGEARSEAKPWVLVKSLKHQRHAKIWGSSIIFSAWYVSHRHFLKTFHIIA